ncbi:MAG: hypothetical protein K2X87_10890 [Gemmataceae bacterium]|nr:hypothetical protein [Gemmataceae bacterium]
MIPVVAPFVVLVLPPLPATATPAAVRAAADKAMPLLRAAAEGHVDQKSCFGCHNQTYPLLAFAAAKDRGFGPPAEVFTAQAEHVAAFLGSNAEKFRKGEGTGGAADTAATALYTLELAGHHPDDTTAAVVEYLLKTQPDREHWRVSGSRPPTEASSFSTTYLAARALRVWTPAPEQERAEKRIAAARGWLLKTPAKDTEDRVYRLFGLKEVGADEKEIAAAAWELLKTQRADGGWGQKDDMAADAYATGTALVALHRAGGLPADHPAYARGVAFLLRTQLPDGSWHVKTRSVPFQPYFEGGFPHGKDQFISSSATGWAASALVLACPPR